MNEINKTRCNIFNVPLIVDAEAIGMTNSVQKEHENLIKRRTKSRSLLNSW